MIPNLFKSSIKLPARTNRMIIERLYSIFNYFRKEISSDLYRND